MASFRFDSGIVRILGTCAAAAASIATSPAGPPTLRGETAVTLTSPPLGDSSDRRFEVEARGHPDVAFGGVPIVRLSLGGTSEWAAFPARIQVLDASGQSVGSIEVVDGGVEYTPGWSPDPFEASPFPGPDFCAEGPPCVRDFVIRVDRSTIAGRALSVHVEVAREYWGSENSPPGEIIVREVTP